MWHLFVSHKITNFGSAHSISLCRCLFHAHSGTHRRTLLIFAQFNSLNRSIHFDRMCVVAMFKYPKIKVRFSPLMLQTTAATTTTETPMAATAAAAAVAINSHSVPIFGLSSYFLPCEWVSECVLLTLIQCVSSGIHFTINASCHTSIKYLVVLSPALCVSVGIFEFYFFFLFDFIVWYTKWMGSEEKHTQNHTPHTRWNFQCDNRRFSRSAAHTHAHMLIFCHHRIFSQINSGWKQIHVSECVCLCGPKPIHFHLIGFRLMCSCVERNICSIKMKENSVSDTLPISALLLIWIVGIFYSFISCSRCQYQRIACFVYLIPSSSSWNHSQYSLKFFL